MGIPAYYSEVYVKDNGDFHGALAIRGPQGPKGDTGAKGDKGDGIKIDGVSDTLPSAASHPDEVWLRNILPPYHLYYSDGTDWIDIGTIQGEQGERGEQGDPGVTPSFSYDAIVSVSNTPGTPYGTCVLETVGGQYVFNFAFNGIKGEKGNTGNTGAQGPKGDPFTYADFTVAQLEALRGPQGIQGIQGEKGDPGTGIGTFYYTPIVLISNIEPSQPVNNLLYIQNDSAIDTGFVHVGYTTDKPTFNPDGSNIKSGDVYIMQGKENSHPLLWGNIKVYPLRVWVYDGSEWVAKSAKSYVNDTWYQLNSVWLIENGEYTGTYTEGSYIVTSKSGSVRHFGGSGLVTMGTAFTANLYPFRVHVNGEFIPDGGQYDSAKIGISTSYPPSNTSIDGDSLARYQTYTNYVSNIINGNYTGAVAFYLSGFEANIKDLWVEFLFSSDIPI